MCEVENGIKNIKTTRSVFRVTSTGFDNSFNAIRHAINQFSEVIHVHTLPSDFKLPKQILLVVAGSTLCFDVNMMPQILYRIQIRGP